MPFIDRSMFEKHAARQQGDDNLHVNAISNPVVAAQIAAQKLVMNTHLSEKLHLLDTEKKADAEYIKTIIHHESMQHVIDNIIQKHNDIAHAKAPVPHGFLGRVV